MKEYSRVTFIAGVVMVLLMALCAWCLSPASAETYPATMIVVSVDYDADEVALLDYNGNVWVILGGLNMHIHLK